MVGKSALLMAGNSTFLLRSFLYYIFTDNTICTCKELARKRALLLVVKAGSSTFYTTIITILYWHKQDRNLAA